MTNKKHLLGVMQGRLLPKYKGRYQAHPVGYWAEEFSIAADLGLDLIEFILDKEEYDMNPLANLQGIKSILKVADRTRVSVKSICADYFMVSPLFTPDGRIDSESVGVLKGLIQRCADLPVTDIVIPCVDSSSLDSEIKSQAFQQALSEVYADAEKFGINLALETDFDPQSFKEILRNFGPRVTVNYDTGNSASLGFDPEQELEAYGERITDIHIKDRFLHGSSTILGQGDTQFDAFLRGFEKIPFNGHFIMQAYRDDEGIQVFKAQLDWVRTHFATIFGAH